MDKQMVIPRWPADTATKCVVRLMCRVCRQWRDVAALQQMWREVDLREFNLSWQKLKTYLRTHISSSLDTLKLKAQRTAGIHGRTTCANTDRRFSFLFAFSVLFCPFCTSFWHFNAYIPRNEGGKGLISIEEAVYMEEQSLSSRCTDISDEELLRATKTENVLNGWNGETDIQRKHRMRQEYKEKWIAKPLHGQFLRQTQQVATRRTELCWHQANGLKK